MSWRPNRGPRWLARTTPKPNFFLLSPKFSIFSFSPAFGFFRRYRRRPSPPISRRERVTGVSRAEAPVKNFRRDARPLAAQNFALSISEIFSRASKKKFRKIFFRRFFHSSRVPCQSRSCPSDSPVTPPSYLNPACAHPDPGAFLILSKSQKGCLS